MKRAPWYLVAGAIAGFAGVIGLHGRAAPAGAAPAAAAPGPAAAGGTHTLTGPTEQYGYGELAVRVTVDGSRITDVTVPVLQTAEQYSQNLAEQTIPELKSQVLAADSAGINGVSGATFTSRAYAESVQAALDKLHAK
jgi:uncharacterized protein with FMN-binding domain